MAPSEHSEFSPSGMSSKLKCPGQHKAVKDLIATAIAEGKPIKDSGGPAADRGTECHDWAETLLIKNLSGHHRPPPPEYFVEDWQEGCTRDMVQHAIDEYHELAMLGDVELELELEVNLGGLKSTRFDLSRVFGTVDVVMRCAATETLVVLDYKTGMGPVNPENNVQLMIYALGVLSTPGYQGFVDKVRICISQPRVDPYIKIWNTTRDELLQWLTDVLIPALIEMDGDDASFNPGKSQCQWCPMAGQCTAQRDKNIAMFNDVKEKGADKLTNQEVNDLLIQLPEFVQFTNQIQGLAQGMLENGEDLPDFKLVRGRGSRSWTNAEDAEKFLRGQKLKEKERYTYKLLSPPQAEKVLKENLKRTVTKNNFDKLVEKKEGKITWALKTDKREAIVIDRQSQFDQAELEDLI